MFRQLRDPQEISPFFKGYGWFFPGGLKQLGRESHHSSKSRAGVKERVEPSRCARGQPQCPFHNLQGCWQILRPA